MISRIISKLKNNFFLKLIGHIPDGYFYIRLSSWYTEFAKFPIMSINEGEKRKGLMDSTGVVPEDDVPAKKIKLEEVPEGDVPANKIKLEEVSEDDVVPAKKIKLEITTEKVKNNYKIYHLF